PDPAGAAHELALPCSHDLAVVGQEMEDPLQRLGLEEGPDGGHELDRSPLQRPIGERGSMEVARERGRVAERSDQGAERGGRAAPQTTRASVRGWRASEVNDSPRRTPGWAKGADADGSRAGERRNAAPTRPADSATITMPTASCATISSAASTSALSRTGLAP